MAFIRLRSPRHGRIRYATFVMCGNIVRNFAALFVEVAHQLTGNINDTQPGIVIGNVEFVILHPKVMRAGFGYLVAGYFLGFIQPSSNFTK